jgi:hypothetical protein
MTTKIFAGFVVLFIGTPALAGPPSYNKLFQPKPLEQVAREQRRAEQDTRTRRGVVDGLPSIPLNPNVDPKIFIKPPSRR